MKASQVQRRAEGAALPHKEEEGLRVPEKVAAVGVDVAVAVAAVEVVEGKAGVEIACWTTL